MIDFASLALGGAVTAGLLLLVQLAEERIRGRK